MNSKKSILLGLLVISASAFTLNNYKGTPEPNPTKKINTTKGWTTVETAIKLAKADQKKIIIDVYTDWCKWCKVMDKNTFSDPSVAHFLNEHFHLAKFNAEQQEDIQFKGKKYAYVKSQRRGYHELAVELLNGQLSYPSLVVFDHELNKLQVIRGYKNADELLKILRQDS